MFFNLEQLFAVQINLLLTVDFVQVENQYGASICLRELLFILRFFENVEINMEQLFVVQIDAFLARNPQRCELRGNLIKHKVWGGFFGALGRHGAV